MKLRLAVPATAGDPTSQAVLDLANDAASQQATAWTEPVYAGTETLNGQTYYIFYTDAVPKGGIVTTDNISPALLPPHVA